ncbi:TraH family protein [Ensifer canadensis]|uniref:TraH family protein n=1 Tax=Ensifer canadensis TaxID=555315 RepID=UPI0014904A73|nr:TraH family protein [Ensifer canadensis]NOV21505.1 conjugal transfer protein TraH [Ensifer canadensis]
MIDAALIEECADRDLKPAVVERFIKAAGSSDPLSIMVRSGDRLILVPKARAHGEAMEIIRRHVASSVVRVGITQYPASFAFKDMTDPKPELLNACENLRMGTMMFARILRIVAKWYGNSNEKDVLPEVFEDAVHAWKTGEFEGVKVFRTEDPAYAETVVVDATEGPPGEAHELKPESVENNRNSGMAAGGRTEIRIDLSRINGPLR